VPYCLWAYINFGNILPFVSPYSTNAVNSTMSFGWGVLAYFNIFGLQVMFWLFLIGMIMCLRLFLYLDIILKGKTKDFNWKIFILTLISITLAFYIFFIKQIEDRWCFILLPIMTLLCSYVLITIYNWLCEKNIPKWIGISIIIILLFGAGYEQIKYANTIIDVKKDSYIQVKQASEWIKQNSYPDDLIMSISYPQTVYYSQRHTETYSTMNYAQFNKYINENHPIYLIVSLIEPNHPNFIWQWSNNQSNVVPVQAYYADPETKTTPVLIVYRFVNW
jgi:hypothetical protein